jgi:adenylate cyclase
MAETRKLVAILAADVVGYSRLAGTDEDRTLARLRALRNDLIDPTIAVHHGRVVKRTGDGSLVEFRSVVDAVRCAIEVQSGMVERNVGLPPATLGVSGLDPTATGPALLNASPPVGMLV